MPENRVSNSGASMSRKTNLAPLSAAAALSFTAGLARPSLPLTDWAGSPASSMPPRLRIGSSEASAPGQDATRTE